MMLPPTPPELLPRHRRPEVVHQLRQQLIPPNLHHRLRGARQRPRLHIRPLPPLADGLEVLAGVRHAG